MRKKHHTKRVHEGQYVAEVEVELIETDEGWSPYCRWKMPTSWTMSVLRYAGAIYRVQRAYRACSA